MTENTLFSNADKPHILVVDDDDRIRDLLSRFLRDQGMIVSTAPHADAASLLLEKIIFDALIVDVMMPGTSGLLFTQSVKRFSDVPILLLTALGETQNRIEGLEKGADDYLAKPFEPKELLLRLKAIMRRRTQDTSKSEDVTRVGAWVYNKDLAELRSDTQSVRLTQAEATLFEVLARHQGRILSREDLARLCGLDGNDRTIDVQVTRLRRKMGDDSKAPLYLQTIRGQGYRLRLDKAQADNDGGM
jgi:two-component system, OmpR family, phosphate regulon response regulator OmpR